MSTNIRKEKFSALPGGTTFHSSAFDGTVQPFVKLDRKYHDPFPFNAVWTGHGGGRSSSGKLTFFKDDADTEIESYPWEVG